jgi:hypothetical protein
MRFIAGYAELYDEWAWFCSALKQMKDRKTAVNSFDAPTLGMPQENISFLRQHVALQNKRCDFVSTKVQRESA